MPLSDYLMHVSCIAFHDIPTTIYISSERGDAGEPDVKLCLSSTVPKTTSTEAPTDPINQTNRQQPNKTLYKWRASTVCPGASRRLARPSLLDSPANLRPYSKRVY